MDRLTLREIGCDQYLDSIGQNIDVQLLWRGFGQKKFGDLEVIPAVINRMPRNNSLLMHRIVDEWFFEKFGFGYRSGSLFCTGNKEVANNYGNVYSIFPFDGFRLCWSPRIRDLYSELSLCFVAEGDVDAVIAVLESGEYREGDLVGAVASGCEIMISAQGFYVSGY